MSNRVVRAAGMYPIPKKLHGQNEDKRGNNQLGVITLWKMKG